MTDATDVGLCVALADIARRDLLAAVAQSPRIRRLFLESLTADLVALNAAEVADAGAERRVLAFPGGDVEVE
jgi:hypothetical protein